MSLFGLIFSSLRHYFRWHLGLLAGVALVTMVIAGAKMIGESVDASLAKEAAARLGGISHVLNGGDRFFTAEFSAKVSAAVPDAQVAPLLAAEGTVSASGGGKRANGIMVLGVDDRFWRLAPADAAPEGEPVSLGIGKALAARLGVAVGETLLARVEVPGAISKDAPLSGSTRNTVTIRRKISHILGDEHLARFGLRSSATSALNLFVPQDFLGDLLEQPGRANLLLVGGEFESATLQGAVESAWTMEDLGLALSEDNAVMSSRIFLSPAVEKVVSEIAPESQGVLTYMVNSISSAKGASPYSMATATDEFGLAPGTCAVHPWLVEDQKLEIGDELTLSYFVMGTGRELVEESFTVKVATMLKSDDPRLNPGWTPEFPGVSDEDNCRDWDPGFDTDLTLIRDKDEDYWDTYRGTPKVFLPLAEGEKAWSNRFGQRTGVRLAEAQGAGFEEKLKSKLTMGAAGFALVDVAALGQESVGGALDLGGYFLGMSFFLIVAAVILAVLLFLFTVEHRSSQLGLQLALGLPQGMIRRALLIESLLVALLGTVVGGVLAVLYAKIMLGALSGRWGSAVGGLDLALVVSPAAVVGAAVTALIIAAIVLWLAMRGVFRSAPQELLAGEMGLAKEQAAFRKKGRGWRKRKSFWIGLLALLGGLGLLFGKSDPGSVYGAGMLFMVAGICLVALLLARCGNSASGGHPGSLWSVGMRNAMRRRGRSLAVCAMMAAGVFMVVAINAFRLDATTDLRPEGGTGGFALIGESVLPVYDDLNHAEGRETFGLEPEEMEGVEVVPFRVRPGDDASCLNLAGAPNPVLLGCKAEVLAEKGVFTFSKTLEKGAGWEMLNAGADESGAIPGVADLNTAMYALHKKLGDVLTYEDESGAEFKVRLVGFTASSVLQGRILISEKAYIEKFPDDGGYRFFLINAPEGAEAETGELLNRQLDPRGLATQSAAERLNEYNAVQNSYLSIFSTLGGLGVLLGTVGLGVLVARSVSERRAELGLLQAVGFDRSAVLRIVLGENWFLHLAGLLIGAGAALVAVWPQLTRPGSDFPLGWILGLTTAVLIGGLAFCWIAGRLALRGSLIGAVRSE